MSHILIVEDELKIASVLAEFLEQTGYDVSIETDGQVALELIRERMPDLIVLDIMLPGLDGLDVCKSVREFSDVPIIMVTARVDEIDRLLGLELGADDYVCKPFSTRELVARIKANLRRVNKQISDVKEAEESGLVIDPDQHLAQLDGHSLDLTPVEFRLLKVFAEYPGRVWSRDALLDQMYSDYRVVSDRTVDSHINNLRRKLSRVRPDHEFIRSVYGVGYKFDLAI